VPHGVGTGPVGFLQVSADVTETLGGAASESVGAVGECLGPGLRCTPRPSTTSRRTARRMRIVRPTDRQHARAVERDQRRLRDRKRRRRRRLAFASQTEQHLLTPSVMPQNWTVATTRCSGRIVLCTVAVESKRSWRRDRRNFAAVSPLRVRRRARRAASADRRRVRRSSRSFWRPRAGRASTPLRSPSGRAPAVHIRLGARWQRFAPHALGETDEALAIAHEEAELARKWRAPRALGRALRVQGLPREMPNRW
jgi:hypothetical protein